MRPRHFVRALRSIAGVTASEVLRDRLLYNGIVVGGLVLLAGTLSARLTYTQPERITLDFGMAGLRFSLILVAALAGSTLIPREFERRTIYLVFSRPIGRGAWVLGKFSGLALVLLAFWSVISFATLVLLLPYGSDGFVRLTPALGWQAVLSYLEALVVAAVATCFSTVTTPSLSIGLTGALWLIGVNGTELRAGLAQSQGKTFWIRALEFLPAFDHLKFPEKMTYGMPFTPPELLWGLGIAAGWVALPLLLASRLIRSKPL